jgi:hypothetical protein
MITWTVVDSYCVITAQWIDSEMVVETVSLLGQLGGIDIMLNLVALVHPRVFGVPVHSEAQDSADKT